MLVVRVDERSHQQHERGNGDEREYAHDRGLALGSPIDQTGRPAAKDAREAKGPSGCCATPPEVKKADGRFGAKDPHGRWTEDRTLACGRARDG
jgi:hypothetical protein